MKVDNWFTLLQIGVDLIKPLDGEVVEIDILSELEACVSIVKDHEEFKRRVESGEEEEVTCTEEIKYIDNKDILFTCTYTGIDRQCYISIEDIT